jgi:hypothetical protein
METIQFYLIESNMREFCKKNYHWRESASQIRSSAIKAYSFRVRNHYRYVIKDYRDSHVHSTISRVEQWAKGNRQVHFLWYPRG